MIDAHIAPRTTLSHLNTPAIAARRSFHRVVGNLADQAPSSWAQPRATGAADPHVRLASAELRWLVRFPRGVAHRVPVPRGLRGSPQQWRL